MENSYSKEDYTLWKNTIYRATNDGTSSGDSPLDDINISWDIVDPFGWAKGTTYLAGDIATYQGMLYRAKIGHISTGTSIYEDKANTTLLPGPTGGTY